METFDFYPYFTEVPEAYKFFIRIDGVTFLFDNKPASFRLVHLDLKDVTNIKNIYMYHTCFFLNIKDEDIKNCSIYCSNRMNNTDDKKDEILYSFPIYEKGTYTANTIKYVENKSRIRIELIHVSENKYRIHAYLTIYPSFFDINKSLYFRCLEESYLKDNNDDITSEKILDDLSKYTVYMYMRDMCNRL